jgi:hypothetical protein
MIKQDWRIRQSFVEGVIGVEEQITSTQQIEVHVLALHVLEIGEKAELKVYIRTIPDGKPRETLFTASSSNEEVARINDSFLEGIQKGNVCIKVEVNLEDRVLTKELQIQILPKTKAINNLVSSNHPRLLFTKQERDQIRDSIKNNEMNVLGINNGLLWQKLKEKADRYLHEKNITITYPNISYKHTVPVPIEQYPYIPDPEGLVDYPYWTQFSIHVQKRLAVLSLAYSASGNQDYAHKIKEYLLSLASFTRWYEFPERSVKWNLSTPFLVLGISIAYDSIFEILTENEREVIRMSILEKGLRPSGLYIGDEDQHNIVVANQAAMIAGSLAILGETDGVEKYVEHAKMYLENYLNSRLNMVETEGLFYNAIAAKNITLALWMLQNVTGEKLIQHPYLMNYIPEQLFFFQAAGNRSSFANFSDSLENMDITLLMCAAASIGKHPVASHYLKAYEYQKEDLLFFLKDAPPPESPEYFYKNSYSKVFQSIGWSSIRNGWGEGSHVLGFTSSPSARDHNHYDQNDIILNVAGEWLITTPGYQEYSPGPRREYTLGTIGHNCLLVNGKGQTVYGDGETTLHILAPLFDAVTGMTSKSYGGEVDTWKRTIWHVDQDHYVVMDYVEKNNEQDTLEFLFHTLDDIKDIQNNSLADSEVNTSSLRFSGEIANAVLHFHGDSYIRIERYKGAEEYGPYARVQPKENHLITWIVPEIKKIEALVNKFNFTDLMISSSSGEDTDFIAADHSYLMFRSNEKGSSITFSFTVEKDALYNMKMRPYLSPHFGIVTVSVDDNEAGEFCGYYPFDRAGEIVSLGEIPLSQGEHTITFTIKGKHDLAYQHFMGLAELIVSKSTEEITSIPVDYKWKQLSNDHFTFKKIDRSYHYILGNELLERTYNGMTMKTIQGWFTEEDKQLRFGMLHGAVLQSYDKLIFQSDNPVHASGKWEADRLEIAILAQKKTVIKLLDKGEIVLNEGIHQFCVQH